jgi:DNA-binding CsgD family transcriptional regulator
VIASDGCWSLGGLVGSAVLSGETQTMRSTLLALAVVCVTAALLPPLHSHLAALLKGRAFLEEFAGPAARAERFEKFENLSERESQVAYLLLEQKTYRAIAAELSISENTVKYYIKNIYAKLEIRSRSELIAREAAKKDMVNIK